MSRRAALLKRLASLAKGLEGKVLPYSNDRAVVISAEKFYAIRQCGADLVAMNEAARPKYEDTATPFCRPQPRDTGTGAH